MSDKTQVVGRLWVGGGGEEQKVEITVVNQFKLSSFFQGCLRANKSSELII